MQKKTLKKLLLLVCMLLSIQGIVAQTGNPLWNLPSNYWPVGPNPLSSLPSPPTGTYKYDGSSQGYYDTFDDTVANPPYPSGLAYHSGPYNMYKDKSGNPLFFIVGGVVFNSQGY